MSNLLPKILGYVSLIVTLAIATTINTANAAVTAAVAASANATSMIGMTAVDDFAAPIMILSLLFTGGMLAAGKVGDGSVKDMMQIISAVVSTIVALSLFVQVISYVQALLASTTGFAHTIYGVIPIIIYIAIIAGAGVVTAVKYLSDKKKTSKSNAANY